MAAVPKVFVRAFPAATTTTNISAPTGYRWIVTSVVLVNNSATAALATVNLDGYPLVYTTLPAGGQYVLDCKQVLDATKAIGYSTSVVSTVNFHISGIEQGL